MARLFYPVAFCVVISVGILEAKLRSFTAEKQVVKLGGRISLSCTYDSLGYREIQHINKHLNNKTFHITEEDQSEFGPRFTLNTVEQNNIETETLTITDVDLGDSGNYSCSLFNSSGSTTTYIYLNISVEEEPDTIRLFLDNNEVINGSTAETLKPLKGYSLRCETTGSNPEANITITYGGPGKPIPVNTTASRAIYRYDLRNEQSQFLVPVERNTTADASHWVFRAEDTSSQVVCWARVSKDAPAIFTGFTPRIEDANPQFECNDTVFATNGQRNFIIKCYVFSKPALSKAVFLFKVGTTNSSIEGFPWNTTRSSSDGKYQGLVQVVNELKSVMSLTVVTVDTRTKITYTFEAGNAKGITLHSVTIRETGSVIASMASSLTSVALLFILFFVSMASFLVRL